MEMRPPEGTHMEGYLRIGIAVPLANGAGAPRETAMRHAILTGWARNVIDAAGDLVVLTGEGIDRTGGEARPADASLARMRARAQHWQIRIFGKE
jgi:hypothetical protein